MSVQWLQPFAWWGLTLLLLPIVVHLLARDRRRRVRFPSLQFLPGAQMAALRRRRIADWPLLILRLLVIASAVAASAAPVITSAGRRAHWDTRVARAIVVAPSDDPRVAALVQDEATPAFTSAAFRAEAVPDALSDAIRWLERQPPAAREIAVVGDLRHGALFDTDIATVPAHVGLRFLPVLTDTAAEHVRWQALAESEDGGVSRHTIDIAPGLVQTTAQYAETTNTEPPTIRVMALPAEQAHAEATLRVVLREGVALGTAPDRSILVEFKGAHSASAEDAPAPSAGWMRRAVEHVPDVRGSDGDNGTLLVRADVAARDPRAATIMAAVLDAAFADVRIAPEPRRIPPATLADWSRPTSGSPANALSSDEGDRRWLWGVALLLLALEAVIRRRRHVA